ncbi:hypothetical protein ACVBEQ_14360 [Nakamurella sp. GG22]
MYSDQLGTAPTLDERRRESRPPPVAHRSHRRRRLIVACSAGLLLFIAGIAVGAGAGRSGTGAVAVVPPTVTMTVAPQTGDPADSATDPAAVNGQIAAGQIGEGAVAGAADPTLTAVDPTLSDVTIADGDWFIGAQVRAGSYRNTSPDCYWARLSGTSGTLAEIIANGIGPGVVSIAPDDYAFTSNRCNWAFLG